MLQCVRCIDPFISLGIWSYGGLRFLQLSVTITIYFQYSSTTYIVMDTLYACALKRTPNWLAVVVSILPVTELVVGFSMYICEFLVAQQWVGAVISFYVVLVFTVNLATYNVSGLYLIRILRNHQKTGISATGEDITGSKSASPFDVVISKTMRSMVMLSVPSIAALIMFFILGVGNLNTRPPNPYNAENPPWSALATMFLQLVLGLLFTRVCWISKTALQAEIISKGMSTPSGTSTSDPPSQGSPDQKRSGRTLSRAEKERAKRMSQSPKPRRSENRPSTQNSRAEPETASIIAVTVDTPKVAAPEIQASVQGAEIV
jgi:hypothetical protein